MKQYLFNTGATISCMSKACFDKLYLKPKLTQTYTYKVNGANANSLGPLGTPTCTLEFTRKFQQQSIVCEHLLRSIILELDFSHKYQIGINWFHTKHFHFCQEPWSIVVSDPAPLPLHIIQISTLPPPNLLVKTMSQVTVPSRTLATV